MKQFSLYLLLALAAVAIAGCGGGGKAVDTHGDWTVTSKGSVLEIGYKVGNTAPQYAALHTESSYFRLVYGPEAGWGTSVILMPSFWERSVTWEELASPSTVIRLCTLDGQLIALTHEGLFRSGDLGTSWQPINIGLATGNLSAIDIDQGNIYLACRNGIAVSTDQGASFQWSFSWHWDGCADVDLQNGYGWAAIPKWGSQSGPKRKTPDSPWWILRRGDIPWGYMSMYYATADPLDPYNIGYLSSDLGVYYRTLDSGEHWLNCDNAVIYAVVIDGKSVIFGWDYFSEDRGATWRPIGIGLNSLSKNVITRDDQTGSFYAASYDRGVFRGQPEEWAPHGLSSQRVCALTILDNQLFAATEDGKIFRTSGASEPVLRQGAPISATWSIEGDRLAIHFIGAIAGLRAEGDVSLSPPTQDQIIAQVEVSTSGDVALDNRPGEAFKPVMLSSMHVSDDEWDTEAAFIGSQIYPLPSAAWINDPPVDGATFGLKGGTSAWKENAPTIEITLPQPLTVTGWVTPSSDPNDDNVGFWAASNQVVRSWQYTITAKP